MADLRRISEPDRQAVLDAAAVLQVRRSETAAALASGRSVQAEIVSTYTDTPRPVVMFPDQSSWTELLSVRTSVVTSQLRSSLPNTRMLVTGGMRMTSIYDVNGTPPDAKVMLAGETLGTYLISAAPIQMKIVNRTHVLLQGPVVGDRVSVMAVRSPVCMEAAWRYWEATRRAAIPVSESVELLGELTPRQRQVVALMATGAGDDAIATSLGVSVRTVRSEVASILERLGVQSRFAAGVRLQLWSDDAG